MNVMRCCFSLRMGICSLSAALWPLTSAKRWVHLREAQIHLRVEQLRLLLHDFAHEFLGRQRVQLAAQFADFAFVPRQLFLVRPGLSLRLIDHIIAGSRRRKETA